MGKKFRPKPKPEGFEIMRRMTVVDNEWIYEGLSAAYRLREVAPPKPEPVPEPKKKPTILTKMWEFWRGNRHAG